MGREVEEEWLEISFHCIFSEGKPVEIGGGELTLPHSGQDGFLGPGHCAQVALGEGRGA